MYVLDKIRKRIPIQNGGKNHLKKIIDYDSKASFVFVEDNANHKDYIDSLIEREEQEETEEIIIIP